MKSPVIINDTLTKEDYERILKDISNPKRFHYQESFSRYVISDGELDLLKELADKITPLAREVFESENLLPTYTLFSHYEGKDAKLWKHKDDNACTYTIDMCVYQKDPWDLWVEDKNYTLNPNQSLAYYGNDQLHWREEFPNPETNHVAMIFFHFAEPDHWWFTKGPNYHEVVRGNITEEEFKSKL